MWAKVSALTFVSVCDWRLTFSDTGTGFRRMSRTGQWASTIFFNCANSSSLTELSINSRNAAFGTLLRVTQSTSLRTLRLTHQVDEVREWNKNPDLTIEPWDVKRFDFMKF